MRSLLEEFYQYQILLFSQSDWGAPIDPVYTELSAPFQPDSSVDTFYPDATDPSEEPTITGAAANPSNYEDPSYGTAPFDLNQAPEYEVAPVYEYESASVDSTSYQGPPYWAATGYSSDYQVLSAPYYETLPDGSIQADRSIDPTVPASAPAEANPSNGQTLPHAAAPADTGIDTSNPATAGVPGANATVPMVAG